MNRKIIIAGGTGFIGRFLSKHFVEQGDEVIVFTRSNRLDSEGVQYVKWDGESLGYWSSFLEDTDVLINMNGRSVDCRYNEQNKQEIYASRIQSTFILGEAIKKLKNPPKLWVNSSSATIYRHSEDLQMGEENGELGKGFSVDVVKKWEKVFFESDILPVRKVALRTAIVLGRNGGALRPLINLSKIGFGGRQGNGRQFFSWIHEQDMIDAIEFIIENISVEGVVNIAAPIPEKNRVVMQTIRKKLKMPIGICMPKYLLEIGARIIKTETELILKSRNVVPHKLEQLGFQFKYHSIDAALENLIRSK